MLKVLDNFGDACRRLADTDLDVHEASYDRDCFGSWYIDLSATGVPMHRILWDGKDWWLIVQLHQGNDDWSDKWIGREIEQQTLEEALAHIRS